MAADSQRLIAAVNELPETEKLVVTLAYFEELTISEIANTLGESEQVVADLRDTALQRLTDAGVLPRRSSAGA